MTSSTTEGRQKRSAPSRGNVLRRLMERKPHESLPSPRSGHLYVERPESERLPPLDTTKNNSPQGGKAREPVPSEGYDSCPSPVVFERVDTHTGEVDWCEIPCQRKTCPYCRERLRARHVAHFIETFKELPHLRFVTLTLDPKAFPDGVEIDPKDFEDTRKYLLHIWERRYVKRVKRASDVEVKYVASIERQQSGVAHLHAVISSTLSEDELRHHWFQSGGGVVMEARPIFGNEDRLARRIGYVMKYCFKAAQEATDGRNTIFCSNGVGYYSEAAKEKRREYMQSRKESTSPFDSDRYEMIGPEGGGHRNNGDTVTEADRRRFDRIAAEARTQTYIKWENDPLPMHGIRVRYDAETGETKREPVTKTVEGRIVERVADG